MAVGHTLPPSLPKQRLSWWLSISPLTNENLLMSGLDFMMSVRPGSGDGLMNPLITTNPG
ncbi:hypothetical protein NXF25_021093 [Crotalus adamanteus]|uniref:Uncharacterized protein n=1 Tax=Crotalus adamanteus TaxID=8729 RepID=A0AAW1B770_CROAD